MSSASGVRGRVQLRHLVQFIQFGLVGGSGVVVNFLAFVALTKLFASTPAEQAEVLFPLFVLGKNFRVYHLFSTLAFVIANVWNFELNRVWTFRHGGKSSRKRFGRYFLIGAAAQAVGLVIMSFLLHANSPIHLPFDILDGSTGLRNPNYWAQLIQVFATMPVSFLLQKLWTFGAEDDGTGAVPDPVVPSSGGSARADATTRDLPTDDLPTHDAATDLASQPPTRDLPGGEATGATRA